MQEFRVVWHQCPHAHHDAKVLFVEAENREDAQKIARAYVERKFHVEWFTVTSIKPTEPLPTGRVKEGI